MPSGMFLKPNNFLYAPRQLANSSPRHAHILSLPQAYDDMCPSCPPPISLDLVGAPCISRVLLLKRRNNRHCAISLHLKVVKMDYILSSLKTSHRLHNFTSHCYMTLNIFPKGNSLHTPPVQVGKNGHSGPGSTHRTEDTVCK